MFYLLAVLVIGIVCFGFSLQSRFPKIQSVAQGLLVSFLTLVILFGIGEAYFRFFHAESTGFYTLSNLNWRERYWQVNSDGYRDEEWLLEDFSEHTTVAVIGDSLTAGSGIDDPADRYSNILAELLGDDYKIVNLGEPGSATPTQLENLQGFELRTPDIVIWQYFLNDIEYAALTVSSLPPIGRIPKIAQDSYLLNYIYYIVKPPVIDYWGWLYGNYDNFAIWEIHRAEIEAMVAYTQSIDAELIVVMHPNMTDPIGSIAYIDRVAQTIEAQGETQILRLFDDVAIWSEDVPIIVSNHDPHPSVEFNRHVAERIYTEFFSDR